MNPRLSPPRVHPSTTQAVRELRESYPDTPFLTLGQTVLWDEPVKAAFCRICDELERAGEIEGPPRIVAGVHDTDYFAKLEGITIRDEPFVVLRHNDGDTRGLWSAAGEISALFGAEVVPSRHDFSNDGVSIHKAARAYPGGLEALLNQETDAPLWRALVHTENKPLIAADVKLSAVAPALRQQLRWAFRQSLAASGCSTDFESDEPCQARDVVRKLWNWTNDFLEARPDDTLSDLYRDLIPKIWALVRGDAVCDLQTTTSLDLFRFSPQTAMLPRFRFLDVFLNPATRELAKRCYNEALHGSGIYSLEQFGEGAIPFDVVIPGMGRGTLRILTDSVSIETEPETQICEHCSIESVGQLAALLKTKYGEGVAIVGKAVSLISMLAAEFIFVFHEKASSYTARTQQMNESLRAQGIELNLFPMLRLRYQTWDSLNGVDTDFHLPPHLAGAFGTTTISAYEFSRLWKDATQNAEARREILKSARTPHRLMEVLAQFEGEWADKADAYQNALTGLHRLHEAAQAVGAQVENVRDEARNATRNALQLETEKGDFFRAQIQPLRERIFDLREGAVARLNPLDENGQPRKLSKAERAAQTETEKQEEEEIAMLKAKIAELTTEHRAFDERITEQRTQSRELKQQANAQLKYQITIERGEEATYLRQQRDELENQAELARFLLMRDSIFAAETLRYTNYRPTSWWLPMVSPDGKWFNQIAATAEGRIERL